MCFNFPTITNGRRFAVSRQDQLSLLVFICSITITNAFKKGIHKYQSSQRCHIAMILTILGNQALEPKFYWLMTSDGYTTTMVLWHNGTTVILRTIRLRHPA